MENTNLREKHDIDENQKHSFKQKQGFSASKIVSIEKYQGEFLMITVSAGEHEAEFIFNPKSIKFGAIISLATQLLLTLILTWSKKRKLA